VADDFDPSGVAWVLTKADLKHLLGAIEETDRLTFDLETTGLDEHATRGGATNGGVAARVVLASYTFSDGSTWVVPLSHPDSPFHTSWRKVLRLISRRIQRGRVGLTAHNAKYDVRWVHATTGVDLSDLIAWDTQVSSHLLDETSSTKLKERAPATFEVDRWDDFDLTYPGAAEDVPLFNLGIYAARDTYWTWRLEVNHRQRLYLDGSGEEPITPDEFEEARLGNVARLVSFPTLRTLAAAEQRGMRLDREWVDETIFQHEVDLAEVTSVLAGLYDVDGPPSFAPTSTWFASWSKQATDRGDLEITALTPSGKPQWSKEVLTRQSRQGSDVATDLLLLRGLTKRLEYLRAWREVADPEGYVHATYNVARTRSGRLSSAEPNLQQVTSVLKPAFVPSPGHVFVDLDFSQIELRVAAQISGCEPMREAFQRGDDLHTLLAARVAGIAPEEVTKAQRQASKACIAEGEPVLTDRGEVPIERVVLDHLVWDGIAWVQHSGVIDQGVREVITYDGLTATPDHKVMLSDGSTVCFGHAATSGADLARSGGPDSPFVPEQGGRNVVQREAPRPEGHVLPMREILDQARVQPAAWARARMHVPAEPQVRLGPTSRGAGGAVRRDGAALSAGDGYGSQLWRPWGSGQVREPRALHSVGAGAPATRDLSGSAVRPSGQQGSLRAGQPAASLRAGELGESAAAVCAVHGADGCPRSLVARGEGSGTDHDLRGVHVSQLAHRGAKRGGDRRGGEDVRRTARWARTYDIVDAGPRHRFTVHRKVVSNCNFGLLYGMSAPSFRDYAENAYDVHMSEQEAAQMRQVFFDTWDGLESWHLRMMNRARRDGQVTSPLGRVRRLPEVWDANDYLVGKAERSAINSPVQGMASDLMQMAASSISGTLPDSTPPVHGARVVGTVHDSVLIEVPEHDALAVAEECQQRMVTVGDTLRRLFRVDFDVPLAVEGEVGTRWGRDDLGALS